MAEPWEIFETQISKLKTKISKKKQELYEVEQKLAKVKKQYKEWQEQPNWNDKIE